MIPISVLKAAASLAGDTLLGTLEEIAKKGVIKELVADGELGGSLLKAAFEEDPVTAGLAILVSTLVVAAIGPEVLAAEGLYSVIAFAITKLPRALVAAEKIAPLAEAIATGLTKSAIGATAESGYAQS